MDMLEMTNISTRGASFPPMNSTVFNVLNSYFITSALGLNLVLAFPTNCYILWLSMKMMIQGQSTKILVFNLSLAEIIFCLSLFFAIPEYFFDCNNCRLAVVFFGLVLLTGRSLFLGFICVERYIGVLHPLIFQKLKPMKYRIAISAVGWIFIITSCVMGTTDVIKLYNLLLPQLLFFFLVKLYSCLMVLKALLRPGPGDDGNLRNGVNLEKKIKAFRIILILLVCSSLAYCPVFVSLVLYHILDSEKFLISWSISLCVGILLGIMYPLLHLKIIGKLPFCQRKKKELSS